MAEYYKLAYRKIISIDVLDEKTMKTVKVSVILTGYFAQSSINNYIDYENNSLMYFLYTRFIILYIFYKLHFTFFKVIYGYRKPAYFRKDIKTAELYLNLIKKK